jgi:hypothetical protein
VGLNLNDRWGVAAALILRDIGRKAFRVTRYSSVVWSSEIRLGKSLATSHQHY